MKNALETEQRRNTRFLKTTLSHAIMRTGDTILCWADSIKMGRREEAINRRR